MASIEISPSTSGISPGLESLFRCITEDLTEVELRNTVTAIKSSYKGSFEAQKDQDLYSCLILLEKQGHVTEQNLTLLDKFVAPKATKGEGIKQRIQEFKKLRQQELKPRLELKGREKDVETILERLTKGKRPVVNLHGSSGVGKTTLAKEVCSVWQWKQVVVDLREVSEMVQVYFHLMLALGSPHTIITEEANPVIAKVQQLMKESSGNLLLLLDNVDQFVGGEDEAAKTLNSNFSAFLQRLLGSQAELKKATLKILLTSRNEFLDFRFVNNYEVKPLGEGISGELIGGGGVPSHKREELLEMCKGKPLLLNIVAAILKQETALPEDLLRTLDPLETQQPAAAPPEKGEQQDRETFDFQEEGLDEKQYSCLRKMFFFLPSKQLKDAAVSMSLFCRAFSLDAAAAVLNLDPSEAVVLLEGLRNSKVLSVDPEAKELLYDMHSSIQKFLRSIGNSPAFRQAYQKANETFCSLFIGRIKQMSHLLDKEYITAFNRFDIDKSNFELALDISFKSDYLLIPKDHHESVMIFYVFEFMLDEKRRRSIFNSWASKVEQDGNEGSIICAEMRSRESLQVLNLEGWRKAKEVLQLADDSLNAVEDEYKTSELYSLTYSTYLYAEGEIYYRMGNIPRALESFQRSLKIMEELLHDHTSTARCINSIGNCYNKRGQFEQAMEYYTRAYNMREQLSGSKKHFDMPLFKGQIGTVHEGQENYREAIKYYQEALELAEELNIAGILYKALFYRNIANSYSHMSNFEAAYKSARKAYEIRKDILGKHPQTARIAFQLGLICRNLDEYEEAEDYFTEAWTIEKSLDQGNHSEVRDRIVSSLEEIISEAERKEIFKKDALEFYQRIWEEEKVFQGFEISDSNRAIIDILGKRVSLLGDRRLVKKYQEEALWFYEAAWNSPEMEQKSYLDRETFLETLLGLCKMLSEKRKFDRYRKEALGFYENHWNDKKDEMGLKDQRSILQTLCKLASEEEDETRAKKYKGLLENLQETKEGQKGSPQFLPIGSTAPQHGDNQESDDSGDFEPSHQVQWHQEASHLGQEDEGNTAKKKIYETLETRKQKIDYFGKRCLFNMASTVVCSPLLDRLFQDITSDFSPNERMDVVKSTKGTLHGKYELLENEDLLACLRLFAKQGHVSDNRLTLIEDFVAQKSNNPVQIKEKIDDFKASRLPESVGNDKLQGRGSDLQKIMEKLKTGGKRVVALHGSAGVGKTTLAKEVCTQWHGEHITVDLRGVKEMNNVYLKVMHELDPTANVRVSNIDINFIVKSVREKLQEQRNKTEFFLLFLDNVDQFAEGTSKEAKNLNIAFLQFLEKLSQLVSFGKVGEFKILLTSRNQFKRPEIVDNFEVKPLESSVSEDLLQSHGEVTLDAAEREKLADLCKGTPLLLKGLAAILRQETQSPEELINKIEQETKGSKSEKASIEERVLRKAPLEFEDEGVDVKQMSSLREMFHSLPSDDLRISAMSLSLFCSPFSVTQASIVLGVDSAEAVLLLEGLRTSEIISAAALESKELLYDIHPLLNKYANSMQIGPKYKVHFEKAEGRFCKLFIDKLKESARLLDSDYIAAYNKFEPDRLNYKVAFEISLKSEYHISSEFHELALIASLLDAMVSGKTRRMVFQSWAETSPDDGKAGSLNRAKFKCWEALQVLNVDGPHVASILLDEATTSLSHVLDKDSEEYCLSQGLFFFTEGEVFYSNKNYTKALDSFESALRLLEILKAHTTLARCINSIGNCHFSLGRPRKALEYFQQAYDMRKALSCSELQFDMPVEEKNGKEALEVHEKLWKKKYSQMKVSEMKKFLRHIANLASSIGDSSREMKYRKAFEKLRDTGQLSESSLSSEHSLSSEPQAPEHGDNQESDNSGDFELSHQVQWHQEASHLGQEDEGNSAQKKIYDFQPGTSTEGPFESGPGCDMKAMDTSSAQPLDDNNCQPGTSTKEPFELQDFPVEFLGFRLSEFLNLPVGDVLSHCQQSLSELEMSELGEIWTSDNSYPVVREFFRRLAEKGIQAQEKFFWSLVSALKTVNTSVTMNISCALLNARDTVIRPCPEKVVDIVVSQKSCVERWEEIARELEIENGVIDDIKKKETEDYKRIRSALERWCKSEGRFATTNDIMFALTRVGCAEVNLIIMEDMIKPSFDRLVGNYLV